MRCITGLLFVLFCSTGLVGQINKGRKLAASADYEAALKAFENDVEKASNKPVSLYEIALIYNNDRYKEKNVDKAYQFVARAIQEFQALSTADKKKVQAKGVNLPLLTKLRQDLTRSAWSRYQAQNTVAAYNQFIQKYTSTNKQQLEQAYLLRNKALLEQAKTTNTFDHYQNIFQEYGENMTRYSPKERQTLEKRLLESYISENDWALYPRFEELFPENVYVLDRVAAYDYLKIRRSQNSKDFKQFIDAYPKSPFTKFAQDQLLELTIKSDYLPDYDSFIRAYPQHSNINRLWKRFYDLYTSSGGQEQLEEFNRTYPNYPFQGALQEDLKARQQSVEQPLYERIIQQEELSLILDFVRQYPQSTYIASLENSFYNALKKEPLLRGSRYFLERYPNSPHYDEVLELYYKEYVKDGEWGTLNQFMMEHPEYKNLAQQEQDLKIAEQGAQLDLSKMPTNDNKALYENYIRAAAPKERAFVALQRLLEPAIRQRRWSKAIQLLSEYETAFADDPTNVQQLKLLLESATIPSEVLPDVINATNTERVVGLQTQTLLFARNQALYQATFENEQWTAPLLLPILNEGIEGAYWTFYKPAGEVIYSKGGDLYYRILVEGQWSKAGKFPKDINGAGQERDAHFSADGRALLYSSNSDSVLDWKTALVSKNFHGTTRSNSDLFVVLRDAQGNWQRTINLGDQINTPFAERHPYLHVDGKTLYFSSEGHGGLGGLDLYYARRLDDTWTRWSTPVNIGKGINTADDESACAVGRNYQLFYFTRSGDEGQRLYKSSLPKVK